MASLPGLSPPSGEFTHPTRNSYHHHHPYLTQFTSPPGGRYSHMYLTSPPSGYCDVQTSPLGGSIMTSPLGQSPVFQSLHKPIPQSGYTLDFSAYPSYPQNLSSSVVPPCGDFINSALTPGSYYNQALATSPVNGQSSETSLPQPDSQNYLHRTSAFDSSNQPAEVVSQSVSLGFQAPEQKQLQLPNSPSSSSDSNDILYSNSQNLTGFAQFGGPSTNSSLIMTNMAVSQAITGLSSLANWSTLVPVSCCIVLFLLVEGTVYSWKKLVFYSITYIPYWESQCYTC